MLSTSSFLKYITSRNGTLGYRYLVRNMSKWLNPQDIKIPTAYGHVAAKTWGNDQHEPVLALHGWQDNAGTFDRLIPLLSQDLYIVAIDAPGHGLSSHLPPGTFYDYLQYLIDVKRVVDYMKWDKFSIIGHSLGGQIASLFCALFPERVKNAVFIDVIKHTSYEPGKLKERTRRNIEALLQLEQKHPTESPIYSLEEARKKLITGLYSQITEESADTLLKRGSLPSKCGKGIVFTKDIRLRVDTSLQPISHDSSKGYLQNVRCNLLIIFAKHSIRDVLINRRPELMDGFINLYKKNCRSFKTVEIDGTHFVHLNNPERVAPLIDAFFEENIKHDKSEI